MIRYKYIEAEELWQMRKKRKKEQTNGRTIKRKKERTNERTDKRKKKERKNKQITEWTMTDRRTDGQKNEWKRGQTKERKIEQTNEGMN